MLSSMVKVVLLGAALVLLDPGSAHAQVLKKVKEQAKSKVDTRVKKAEGRILETSGQVVDSAAEKTARGVDTAVSRSGEKLNRAVEGTERAVSGLANKDGADAEIARQLATGRAVLTGIRFTADGAVQTSSHATIRSLAKAMSSSTGAFLVEAHVDASAGAAAQALSQAQATSVKAHLVAEGIDASRLFAMGIGATRPPAGSDVATARIEIARMQ